MRGDLDLAGEEILHRMVRAVVAKLQLEGLPAECDAAKLVAQANAEDGHPTGEITNVFMRVRYGLWVAGAIRKEDTVRTQREDIFRGSVGRNNGDVAVVVDKQAENVLLDAEVVSNNLELLAVLRAGAGLAHLLGPRRSGQFN